MNNDPKFHRSESYNKQTLSPTHYKDFHRAESYSPITNNESSEESYEKEHKHTIAKELFSKKNHIEHNYPNKFI